MEDKALVTETTPEATATAKEGFEAGQVKSTKDVELSLAKLNLEDSTQTIQNSSVSKTKDTSDTPSNNTNTEEEKEKVEEKHPEKNKSNSNSNTTQEKVKEDKDDNSCNSSITGDSGDSVDSSTNFDTTKEISIDDCDPIVSPTNAGASSYSFTPFDFFEDDPDLLNVLQSLVNYSDESEIKQDNNDDNNGNNDSQNKNKDTEEKEEEEVEQFLQGGDFLQLSLQETDHLSDYSVEEGETGLDFFEPDDVFQFLEEYEEGENQTEPELKEELPVVKVEIPEEKDTNIEGESALQHLSGEDDPNGDILFDLLSESNLPDSEVPLTDEALDEALAAFEALYSSFEPEVPQYCIPCPPNDNEGNPEDNESALAPTTPSSGPPPTDEALAAFEALHSSFVPEVPQYCVPCPPNDNKGNPEDSESALAPTTLSSGPPPTDEALAAFEALHSSFVPEVPQYCVPCSPDDNEATLPPITASSDLPPIEEDLEAVESSLLPTAPQYCIPCPPNDGKDLLQASLLKMDDRNNKSAYYDGQGGAVPSYPAFTVSQRPEALYAAEPILKAFGTEPYDPQTVEDFNPKNERSCFGHKETIFGLSFSECGSFIATAGQDSTICIWDVHRNRLLSQLKEHSPDFECLRTAWASPNWGKTQINRDVSNDGDMKNKYAYIVASGGANGIVHVWASPDAAQGNSWTCIGTLDHASLKKPTEKDDNDEGTEKEKEKDVPQIYALSFVDHWQAFATDEETQNSFLITASDDYLHLWEIEVSEKMEPIKEDEKSEDDDNSSTANKFGFNEVMSIRFTDMHEMGGGVTVGRVTSSGFVTGGDKLIRSRGGSTAGDRAFGGGRNPDDLVFVFDASYCSGNGLVGVALSDGTLRLLNGRGICVSILSLPGCESHLTSFTWDSTGTRIATCVATGHLILWEVDIGDGKGKAEASCVAVLEGGHQMGRPLFGAKYCGGYTEELLVSWGVDGRVCLWDSRSHGQIHAPISTLLYKQSYPIYAVDVANRTHKDENKNETVFTSLAVAGGRDSTFLGVPVYVYDVPR